MSKINSAPTYCIINDSHPAWFCSKCSISHHLLYMKGKERYCPECVPYEIKDKAIFMNQNREIITNK